MDLTTLLVLYHALKATPFTLVKDHAHSATLLTLVKDQGCPESFRRKVLEERVWRRVLLGGGRK